MPACEIVAMDDARITLTSGGSTRTVDLYSPDGLAMISTLWVKLATEFRIMYEPRWLGVPIVQLPEDIIMLQEVIWKVRPEVIVECGVAHGGSAVFYASL